MTRAGLGAASSSRLYGPWESKLVLLGVRTYGGLPDPSVSQSIRDLAALFRSVI